MAGTVSSAASGGGSLAQKGLSASRKLQRVVDAADSAVPSRVPTGVQPGVLRSAGKMHHRLPDVDVRTGSLSARLNDLPRPKRQQVTEQFDELNDGTRRYLGDSDVEAPSVKAADLFGSKCFATVHETRIEEREKDDVVDEAAQAVEGAIRKWSNPADTN